MTASLRTWPRSSAVRPSWLGRRARLGRAGNGAPRRRDAGQVRLFPGIVAAALLALVVGCRSRPSGVDYDQWKEALKTRRATAPRHITALPGFEVDLLRTASKAEGSWVSLEFDGQGRLLIGREGPGILRLTLPRWRLGRTKVEVVNDELKAVSYTHLTLPTNREV